MDTKQIDGALFANMLRGGAAALYDHRQAVNDLNVFPIPDGDTGDNMFMTMDSGVAALNTSQTDTILQGSPRVWREQTLPMLIF